MAERGTGRIRPTDNRVARGGCMSGQNGSRRQIAIYVVLVFAFSSVFYFTALRADNLGAGSGMYVLGLMGGPALAGRTTLKGNGRSLVELGWKWAEKSYALGSAPIPRS